MLELLRPRSGAIGTVRCESFESFRSRVRRTTVGAAFQHFSQKCICVSPVMLPAKASRTTLKIDPEAELVLEFDQATELAELFHVRFASEGGEHPCEVTFRGDGRPESLA
jgi:hypothetical protein